tara:strand:+ start:2649 stop:7001 length:4353 start_codon:yes stop_codon:yes gene_type:complete
MAEQLQTITSQLEGVITTPLTSTSAIELEKAKEKVKSITSELEDAKVSSLDKIPKIESITSQLEGAKIVPLTTDTSEISTQPDETISYYGEEPSTWEKIAYGIDKQNMFFGNVWRAGKAGIEAAFDPNKEFKEVMLEDTAIERAELHKRHQKFSTGKYDDDIEVLAAEMATFLVDPYYIFMYMTPWGRAMSMRQTSFKAAAKVAGLSAGAVSLDVLFDNLVTTGEAKPKDVAQAGAIAGVLGPLSMKAFQIIGKLLPGADKAKIAQVVQVIEGKTQVQLGVSKAEFKVLQKIAGDKEFLKLNKQVAQAEKTYNAPIVKLKDEYYQSVLKVDKQLAKLRTDLTHANKKDIKFLYKDKYVKTLSEKILQIEKTEKLRLKEFKKAQTKLWRKQSTAGKKGMELTAKRDVEFLEKLWKAKSLTEKTAQVVLSASVRPLLYGGASAAFGKLWGPEDTNLATWFKYGAALGVIHKSVLASKILPGQSKNMIQRLLYHDATKLSFQKARELTATTTSSKLSAIGGETEKIGLQLLEGIDSTFAKNSVAQRADNLLRGWQLKIHNIINNVSRPYSQAEKDLAISVIRGNRAKVSPRVQSLATKIEGELVKFKKLMNDAGIFSLDEKGKLMEVKNYFPRVWNYEAITKDPKKFEETIFQIFKSLGHNDNTSRRFSLNFAQSLKNNLENDSIINKNEIAALINRYGSGEGKSITELLSNNPLSEHITKSRILQGPYSKVEKILEQNNYLNNDIGEIFNNLYSRSMKSIAFAEKFGEKGQMLSPYIKAIVDKYRLTGRKDWEVLAQKEIRLVTNTIDAFFDRYGTKVSANQRTIAGILSTISNLNMLDRVTIASLGDIVQPFTNSNNFWTFWRGALRTGFTNKREKGIAKNLNLHLTAEIKEKLLRQMGITQQSDDITKASNVMGNMGVIRTANEWGFKIMGLQWLTGLARRYAYNVGAVDAFVSSQKLAKFVSANGAKSLSSSKGLRLVQNINRYNMNVQEALTLGAFKNFDDAVANKAANKVLNQSGILASNRDALIPQHSNRLLFTQSRNPWIRLLGQFTSWAMAKSTQTNKILTRIENGDAKQLVKLLAALPVYGGIQQLRELAKHGEVTTDPGSMEGQWWSEAVRLSGMAGWMPELFIGRAVGPGSQKPWFLPFPVFTVLGESGDVAKDILKGNLNTAWKRFAKKIVPFPTWRRWYNRLWGSVEKTRKFNQPEKYESLDTFERKYSTGGRVKLKKGDVAETAATEDINLNRQEDMNKKDLASIAAAATIATTGVDADINKAVENNILPAEKPKIVKPIDVAQTKKEIKIFNNPGNIEEGQGYAGETGAVYAERFSVFDSKEMGIRALAKDLNTKIKRFDGDVEKIITQYAPPNENDTKAYIKFVKAQLNNKDKITKDDLSLLTKAVILQENKPEIAELYLLPEVFNKGMDLSTLDLPSTFTFEEAKKAFKEKQKTF